MKDGLLIYGIIRADSLLESEKMDIGSPAAPAVFTVRFKDLAAVVSTHPLVAYDTLPKEQVMKGLAVHQLVIEKVMERFTVVPVKFGTMVESKDEIVKFLEKGYALLSDMLEKRKGQIELDIVAWWELPEILPILSRQNSQIQEKQQEIAQKGDRASEEDKILLGQYIQQALSTEKVGYQQLISQMLQQEAEDVCMHNQLDDQIIFNAAFLLEKQNEASFHRAIDTLDQDLQGRLHFRVVGPLPTYSFSTIQVKRIDPESVEAAKKTLALPAEFTDKDVQDAYHKLAREYHPDTSSGEDTQEFQRVHSAHTTLRDFMEHGSIYPEVYQYTQ
ncbi:MAG TPA: GvpL/GvpF family gas vesicle protein [Ktedonobacteraceae bacterium]